LKDDGHGQGLKNGQYCPISLVNISSLPGPLPKEEREKTATKVKL
jgi:hypothetical protein